MPENVVDKNLFSAKLVGTSRRESGRAVVRVTEDALEVLARLHGIASRHEGATKAYAYCPEGPQHDARFFIGCYGDGHDAAEFAIQFSWWGGRTRAKLHAHDTAFAALLDMPELLVWLAQVGPRIEPLTLRGKLDDLGFVRLDEDVAMETA